MILKIKNENGVWIDIPSIQGAPGPAGKTPEKGTDYWTEEDQQSIVDNVLEELGDIAASGDCVHRINNASSLTEEDIEVLTKIYNANAEYMTPILIGEAIITNVVMTGSTLLLFGLVCDEATGAAYVNHFYMWSWNKGATSMSRSKTSGMISGESVYISTLTNSARLSADNAFKHIKNNYALKSEIPDVGEFQTQTQVQSLINTSLAAIGVAEEGAY